MVVRLAFLSEVKLSETQVEGVLTFGGCPTPQAFALNAPYGQKAYAVSKYLEKVQYRVLYFQVAIKKINQKGIYFKLI
jgi:hypothetical protein